jgi:hypothetical protein
MNYIISKTTKQKRRLIFYDGESFSYYDACADYHPLLAMLLAMLLLAMLLLHSYGLTHVSYLDAYLLFAVLLVHLLTISYSFVLYTASQSFL